MTQNIQNIYKKHTCKHYKYRHTTQHFNFTHFPLQNMYAVLAFALVYVYTIGNVQAVILTRENVIFQELDIVSTTSANWKITFVSNILPFQDIIDQLFKSLDEVLLTTATVMHQYDEPEKQAFYNSFLGLRKEIEGIRVFLNSILKTYQNFRILQSRSKRSLLPIVGKALSFLFGTVSEDDLHSIKSNINQLSANQRKISHVVEESLTLLNDTREHVIENRQAINNVISAVASLQTQMQNVTQMIQNDIMDLRISSTAYFQINNFIAELKRLATAAKYYMDDLHFKFNMLSLGHLSPSLVAPKRLQNILSEIKGRLPSHLQLTHDPMKDIWTYYRYLTCTTVISTEHVLVIVSLPLVNVNHKYLIYKVHNLPFPIQSNDTNDLSRNMVAYRTLESSYIAINIERSRYMILRDEDTQKCLVQSLKFCELRRPIYPINLSRLCIIAIFMNEKKDIDNYCQTIVRVNEILPYSEYIADGHYAIATNKPIQLTQACKQLSASLVNVKAPLDIVKLKPSCSMTHQRGTFPHAGVRQR